jgi:hypothetical protein
VLLNQRRGIDDVLGGGGGRLNWMQRHLMWHGFLKKKDLLKIFKLK